MNANKHGEWLTIKQAMEKTQNSREWFYKHMKNGTLPFPWFMQSPGKRLIDSEDIEEWQRNTKIPAFGPYKKP